MTSNITTMVCHLIIVPITDITYSKLKQYNKLNDFNITLGKTFDMKCLYNNFEYTTINRFLFYYAVITQCNLHLLRTIYLCFDFQSIFCKLMAAYRITAQRVRCKIAVIEQNT